MSVILTRSQFVFQLGAWLCKHETALPHTIHLVTIVLQLCCLALTESIHVVMSLYLMWCIPSQGVIVLRLDAWLCKHETALPHKFIWRPSVPQSPALALTESIQVVVMSLYLMSVYSITRSQLCFNWVLDYVSMRLLSPTTIHLKTIHPPVCCSGTHRINTRSNVTVPDVSVFHRKKSIVFQLGAWLCKHETALPHTIHFGDHLSSSCAALALTESIHVVMSLYLMSVYSITRSQLCFNWVLDYVSMRLLSPTQFIWRPSVLQLCCSGTHRSIHVVMSLYLMWSVFHHKSQLCGDWIAWLCKHETALPTQFIWRPSVPQFSSSGTHRINTSSNVTVPDVSVFHHKESIVFQLGAWLCKHETALPTQFIWRPSIPQLCCSGTHRINTLRNVTVPDVSVFHPKESIVLRLVVDYVSMRLLSPTQFIWRPSVLQLCALALTESIHVVMSL